VLNSSSRTLPCCADQETSHTRCPLLTCSGLRSHHSARHRVCQMRTTCGACSG
jgi:hypothetical protein